MTTFAEILDSIIYWSACDFNFEGATSKQADPPVHLRPQRLSSPAFHREYPGKIIVKLLRLRLSLGMKDQLLRVNQMLGHQPGGLPRLSLFDGFHNRYMETQGMLKIDHARCNHHHVQHGAVDHVK